MAPLAAIEPLVNQTGIVSTTNAIRAIAHVDPVRSILKRSASPAQISRSDARVDPGFAPDDISSISKVIDENAITTSKSRMSNLPRQDSSEEESEIWEEAEETDDCPYGRRKAIFRCWWHSLFWVVDVQEKFDQCMWDMGC